MTGRKKDRKIEALRGVPLFAGFGTRDLKALAKISDEVDLPAGTEAIREDDLGRQFFVLLAGEAQVRRRGRARRMLGPGDFFGEIALVTNRPTEATVTTTTEVRALVIGWPAFRKLLRSSPGVQLKVLQALAERVTGD